MEVISEAIPVLDRGFVQYVSHMGDDLTVVNAARVSFNKESTEFTGRDEKLISYLAKHKHWTPFAHPQITLRIKAPISIRTQLFKHKQGFVETPRYTFRDGEMPQRTGQSKDRPARWTSMRNTTLAVVHI
jgi:thymidylate synthase ThyX